MRWWGEHEDACSARARSDGARVLTSPAHRNHCCPIVRDGVSHRRRRRRGGATKARGNLDTQASGGCGAWEPLPAIGSALQCGPA